MSKNSYFQKVIENDLFRHGKTKFATGAGLWTLGALTGNTNLQQTGQALAGLGLLSKAGGLLG